MNTNKNYKVDTTDEIWAKIWPEVDEACKKIFDAVNNVLRVHSNFGFTTFEQNINPSLTDIEKTMDIAEFSVNKFFTHDLEYSLHRVLSNVKQMIFCIKNLIGALIKNDESEYEQMILMMRNQAQH
jgi:hypothetical protein